MELNSNTVYIDNKTFTITATGQGGINLAIPEPRAGYNLAYAVVLRTPNENWIFGYATVYSNTVVIFRYNCMYSEGLTGELDLLLIYKKS